MKFNKYYYLIGFAILAVILLRTDFSQLKGIFRNLNYYYFTLALFISFPMILGKAYRWNYLKKAQGITYKLSDSFLIQGVATYLGFITPGRIGEFIKILYLKKDGNPLGKSMVNVFLDRLLDILFLFILGYFGILLFMNLFYDQIYLFTILFASALFAGALIFKTKSREKILKILYNFFLPLKYKQSWQNAFFDFLADFKKYKLKNYVFASLITIVSWIIYYSQTYLLAKSVGLNISIFYLSISVSIAILITLIPISISGLGTREAALIFLFSLFNISKEMAISFSALALLVSLAAVGIGVVCWFIKPLNRENINSN